MSEHVDCLIVGAGPTGLTLGVGLMKAGKSVLIVEKHQTQLGFSKAILLNSESLVALDEYNCSIFERLLEVGILIDGISFHVDGSVVCSAQFDTENTNRHYPIAVPQEVTENCLRDVFLQMGGRLMRGVAFDQERNHFTSYQSGGCIEVHLRTTKDTNFSVECDWLFGCDGMHSVVRDSLQIPFLGVFLPDKLIILDAIVKSWPLLTHVNGFLCENDAQFVILISDMPLIVRIVGATCAACLKALQRFEVKQVIWDGCFTNSFRLTESYGRGHIWLAGDAAHVHSPVGGRGMNMGILDAVQLARSVEKDTVHLYEQARRPAACTWIWYNYYLTQLFMSNMALYMWLRKILAYVLVVLGYLFGSRLAKKLFESITTQVKLRRVE